MPAGDRSWPRAACLNARLIATRKMGRKIYKVPHTWQMTL
jgi:hypothetical protein